MQHFSISEIKTWDRFYRTNFMNSLSGFKSASLIASIDEGGRPNLAIFSNIVHLGADPALIGFVNRPLAAAPHTIRNIEATGFYTINHIHEGMIQQAHQTSAKYAAGVSEFEATGLTAQYRESYKVPFVAESRVQYALQLVEVIPIRHNNTFFVIGSVQDVFVDTASILQDGYIDLVKAGSMASLGIDGYCQPGALTRFEYAKPDKPVTKINP